MLTNSAIGPSTCALLLDQTDGTNLSDFCALQTPNKPTVTRYVQEQERAGSVA